MPGGEIDSVFRRSLREAYQIHSEYDKNIVLNEVTFNYLIKPLFEGYFVIGGNLPNAVVKSKLPLRLTFNIGEHEITYHISK